MKIRLAILVLAFSICNYPPSVPAVALPKSQSDCPSIVVDAPSDIDGKELIFRVKISGGNMTSESLTYKWTVYGGEIKDGQGTSWVTISNFDLRRKSVTVVIEVEGLPSKCVNTASCTISV